MKTDKQEKKWRNRKKFKIVHELLDEEFKDKMGRGYCHEYWRRKKQLLKEMYNIDWSSPAELNPGVLFD